MTNTIFNPDTQQAWINAFDPKKRIFSGRSYVILKRVMDLGFLILSAPFWLPVLGVISIIIRITSPGAPAIFAQLRTGKGGKRFRMYKFRSMVPNAEALKEKYAHLNELQWPDFKITKDPRVTKVGRFLRKTSLDEIPQLLNVLQGDMSLVGPRPTSFHVKTYDLWQTQRLDVTPGITGLWQIMGRGNMEFIDRVYLDIFYIEHRSLWLDIQILLRTVLAVVMQKGVH